MTRPARVLPTGHFLLLSHASLAGCSTVAALDFCPGLYGRDPVCLFSSHTEAERPTTTVPHGTPRNFESLFT